MTICRRADDGGDLPDQMLEGLEDEAMIIGDDEAWEGTLRGHAVRG